MFLSFHPKKKQKKKKKYSFAMSKFSIYCMKIMTFLKQFESKVYKDNFQTKVRDCGLI